LRQKIATKTSSTKTPATAKFAPNTIAVSQSQTASQRRIFNNKTSLIAIGDVINLKLPVPINGVNYPVVNTINGRF